MSGNEGAAVLIFRSRSVIENLTRCDAMQLMVEGSTYPGRLHCFHVFFRKPALSLLSPSTRDIYDLPELLALSLWWSQLLRLSVFALAFFNGRMDSNEGMVAVMEIMLHLSFKRFPVSSRIK